MQKESVASAFVPLREIESSMASGAETIGAVFPRQPCAAAATPKASLPLPLPLPRPDVDFCFAADSNEENKCPGGGAGANMAAPFATTSPFSLLALISRRGELSGLLLVIARQEGIADRRRCRRCLYTGGRHGQQNARHLSPSARAAPPSLFACPTRPRGIPTRRARYDGAEVHRPGRDRPAFPADQYVGRERACLLPGFVPILDVLRRWLRLEWARGQPDLAPGRARHRTPGLQGSARSWTTRRAPVHARAPVHDHGEL